MNIQINYPSILVWTKNNWSKILLVILAILLFRTCQGSKEVRLANNSLKKDIEISEIKAQNYVDRINLLSDSLIILERRKQAEKIKIVTVVKEVEKKVEAVGSLNTKGIANFYQNRYKLPVVITQYGVSLSDSIAKKNIVELIQKDGLVLELNHTKNVLNVAEKQLNIKDGVLILKDSIISEKDKQIDSHFKIEKNLNKSIKIEKSKKTFWQITAVGILGGSIYLLAK